MKEIDIYIIGKYDTKTRVGTWIYYLEYKRAVIKRVGQVENISSSARITLVALYQALQHVTEPCAINIHSKIRVSFENAKKSANKDILLNILNIVKNAGHEINFVYENFDEKVNMWEAVYGNNSQQKQQPARQKQKSVRPDTTNAKTPNDVFEHGNIEQQATPCDWRNMYSDLMGPSEGAWVPGSGGY